MNLLKSLGKTLTHVRSYHFALLCLVLFLFALYLFYHEHFWMATPDERCYLAWSFNIFKFGEYMDISGSPIVSVPPLHCLFVALSFAVAGPSLDSAQVVSIIFTALCSPLAYCMGKHFYNNTVGIIAGIFTATSFLLWMHSARVLSEPLLIFFVNLSILFLYLTLTRGTKKYPLLLGMTLGLGYLSKELIVFLFPLLLLILYEKEFDIKLRVRNFFLCGITGALVLAPWYYYVAVTSQTALGGITERPIVKGISTSWGFRELGEITAILTFERAVSLSMLILFYVSLFLAARRYLKEKKLSDKLLVLSILTWFALFTFNTYMPVQERRLVPMLVPFYILASRALVGFYERMKKVDVAVEKVKPVTFILIVFLLSYWNRGLGLEQWGQFEVLSFHQNNILDDPLEVDFLDDCKYFSQQYGKDEVVGSFFACLFYFHTEGVCQSCMVSMANLSDLQSENVIYIYNEQKGLSEEELLRQIRDRNITVFIVLGERKALNLIQYLQSKPDIFTGITDSEYKVTFVFEVNREKVLEYLELLEE